MSRLPAEASAEGFRALGIVSYEGTLKRVEECVHLLLPDGNFLCLDRVDLDGRRVSIKIFPDEGATSSDDDPLHLKGLDYARRFKKGTELWLVRHEGRPLWILSLAHEDIVDEVVATATIVRRN